MAGKRTPPAGKAAKAAGGKAKGGKLLDNISLLLEAAEEMDDGGRARAGLASTSEGSSQRASLTALQRAELFSTASPHKLPRSAVVPVPLIYRTEGMDVPASSADTNEDGERKRRAEGDLELDADGNRKVVRQRQGKPEKEHVIPSSLIDARLQEHWDMLPQLGFPQGGHEAIKQMRSGLLSRETVRTSMQRELQNWWMEQFHGAMQRSFPNVHIPEYDAVNGQMAPLVLAEKRSIVKSMAQEAKRSLREWELSHWLLCLAFNLTTDGGSHLNPNLLRTLNRVADTAAEKIGKTHVRNWLRERFGIPRWPGPQLRKALVRFYQLQQERMDAAEDEKRVGGGPRRRRPVITETDLSDDHYALFGLEVPSQPEKPDPPHRAPPPRVTTTITGAVGGAPGALGLGGLPGGGGYGQLPGQLPGGVQLPGGGGGANGNAGAQDGYQHVLPPHMLAPHMLGGAGGQLPVYGNAGGGGAQGHTVAHVLPPHMLAAQQQQQQQQAAHAAAAAAAQHAAAAAQHAAVAAGLPAHAMTHMLPPHVLAPPSSAPPPQQPVAHVLPPHVLAPPQQQQQQQQQQAATQQAPQPGSMAGHVLPPHVLPTSVQQTQQAAMQQAHAHTHAAMQQQHAQAHAAMQQQHAQAQLQGQPAGGMGNGLLPPHALPAGQAGDVQHAAAGVPQPVAAPVPPAQPVPAPATHLHALPAHSEQPQPVAADAAADMQPGGGHDAAHGLPSLDMPPMSHDAHELPPLDVAVQVAVGEQAPAGGDEWVTQPQLGGGPPEVLPVTVVASGEDAEHLFAAAAAAVDEQAMAQQAAMQQAAAAQAQAEAQQPPPYDQAHDAQHMLM